MEKKRIAFVTDSTAFLTKELRDHPDVYVVPIVIISEGKEYEDGINLTSDELYELIRNNKEVPKTSQPSAGKFTELYQQLKENYDYAIAIHVSSKLSGTISSSTAGKDHVGFEVEVIDSLSISYGMTPIIEKGLSLAEQEFGLKDIANQLRSEVPKSQNKILLGSLEQLYKGGRMSGAQFLLGNFLQIKPILTINNEGELGLFERIRSEKKATNKIVTLLRESSEESTIKQIGIMHGNALEKATALKGKIEEVVPGVDVVTGEISSSIAVHAGEGSVALFWHIDE